jgi:AcrR family transcriptional regulator
MPNPPHHDSPPNPATPARRHPVQDRSLRSVKRILDAASALLSRMPLDDVTTTHIAAEAGLSVGGLYRFFPDRETIIDAIAGHHILQLCGTVDRDILRPRLQPLQNPENFPPAAVLDRIIDAYVAYLDAHADFRTISFGRHITTSITPGEAARTGLPAILTAFMFERLAFGFTPDLQLTLRMASEAGERLIAYAYEQPTRDARDRVISEVKRMLAGYLFPSHHAAVEPH